MKNGIIIILNFFLLLSCVAIKTKNNVAIDFYNLGNKYLEIKDYKNAINSYKKSLEFNPKSEETIFNLILCYQYNKEYEKVEELILKNFKKVNKEYTKKMLLLLGNNFYLKNNYEKAIKTYSEYIEVYPEDVNCYFNLALTYLKLSNNKKALETFLEAYRKDNKHIPTIYNLGNFYYNDKDYKNSFYYFSLLEELDKDNPDVYYRLADLEYLMEEYEHSKIHLLKAIELDTENIDYYILLAKVYAKGYKNRKKTLEYLEKAFINGFDDIEYLKNTEEFILLKQFNDYNKLLKKYGLN